MAWDRILRFVVFAFAAAAWLLLGTSVATAQPQPPGARLVVLPDVPGAVDIYMQGPPADGREPVVDTSAWPEKTAKYRVYWCVNGLLIADATGQATWEVGCIPEQGWFIEPGVLRYTVTRNYFVEASIGDLRAHGYFHPRQLSGNAAANQAPPPGPPVVPLTEAQMRQAARNLVAMLNNTGLGLELTNTILSIKIVDAADGHPLAEGNTAQTQDAGWFGGTITITLSHNLAAALVAGQFTQSSPDGRSLTQAAKTLIHELLHAVSFAKGLRADDDANTDPGPSAPFDGRYTGFHDFETLLIDPYFKIKEAGVPKSQWERWKLRQRLDNIRSWYKRYYALETEDPNDPNLAAVKERNRARREIRQIIDTVGLGDADGNGLPDILDQWLREHGINPETLPTEEPARAAIDPDDDFR